MANRKLCMEYFTLVEADVWQCKCGTKRKQRKNSGWMNLLTHIQQQHKNSNVGASSSNESRNVAIENYFVSDKAKNIFGWLDWIIGNLEPFNFVSNQKNRQYSTLEGISTNTFLHNVHKLTALVEEKISSVLPDKFALIIDGWSHTSTHYLAIFASFIRKLF